MIMVPLLTILYLHSCPRQDSKGCPRRLRAGRRHRDEAVPGKKTMSGGKENHKQVRCPIEGPRIISLAVLESDLGFELTAMDAYERRTKGVKKSRIGFHLDDALCLRYFRETWA